MSRSCEFCEAEAVIVAGEIPLCRSCRDDVAERVRQKMRDVVEETKRQMRAERREAA